MSVYGFLNETIENTDYLHRLTIYDSKFLDNIFIESFADFEAINEAIDFGRIKEKLSWKNIWEWIKGIFGKIKDGIIKLAGRIKDFFAGKKKKETEAKLKALEKEIEDLKMENLSLKQDKEVLKANLDRNIKKSEEKYRDLMYGAQDAAIANKEIIKRKNEEISDLKKRLKRSDKDKDNLSQEKIEKEEEIKNLHTRIEKSLEAQFDAFEKAINNPNFYFDMYDYFNKEYDPIRIVRSDWFDKIERYFGGKMNYNDDTDETDYKYPSDIKEISGSFDLFIKECGKKLHIFNDDFSKFLDDDFYINFHTYKIEKVIDAKLEEKMKKEQDRYATPGKTLEHIDWLNGIMHGQAGNLEELIRKFSDVQNRAQQILNKIMVQCQKNNPNANQSDLQTFQTEVGNFISFINKQIQLLAILSTYCAKSIGVVESVANVSKIINTTMTA